MSRCTGAPVPTNEYQTVRPPSGAQDTGASGKQRRPSRRGAHRVTDRNRSRTGQSVVGRGCCGRLGSLGGPDDLAGRNFEGLARRIHVDRRQGHLRAHVVQPGPLGDPGGGGAEHRGRRLLLRGQRDRDLVLAENLAGLRVPQGQDGGEARALRLFDDPEEVVLVVRLTRRGREGPQERRLTVATSVSGVHLEGEGNLTTLPAAGNAVRRPIAPPPRTKAFILFAIKFDL